MRVEKLLTDHIDIWSSALQTRSTAGRGSGGKIDLYGIKKLRELILELAVRGKLVPQDPNDEPASELLKRIAAEKAELVKQGKIKKQKPLPEIREDEKPFELPEGWEWVRLGELFNSIASGGTPSKSNPEFWNGDIPWASVKDLGKEKYISKTQDYISHQGLEAGSKLADEGDILICTRMGLGKIGIASRPVAFNQDLKSVKLTSSIPLDFFFNTYSTVKIKGKGTTVEGIKQEQLLNYVIGLPTVNEQHQIVEKVDELMSLCDQLEQQSLTSLEAHQQLVETLLATLTDSQNAEELAESWVRISQYFDTLFTTEASIDALKQTLLQLAVMGKLVPQDPNDEPASELLKRIAQEKAQLVKEGKIKKQKPLPPVSDEEKPFDLPEGWSFCRLQDITNLITDGKHGDCSNKSDSGYYFLSAKDINDGKLNYKFARQIEPDEFLEVHKRTNLQIGDICMVNTGATVGKMAIVDDDALVSHTTFQKSVAIIKPASPFIFNLYIYIFLESQAPALRIKSGGSAINNLLLGDLKKNITSLPPLGEQKRIVNKVNELNFICGQLKSRLQSAQQTQLHLADALTDAALN
ncbi:restriction endonuclease subunit S [Cronobacter turicensis]|uniref:restriction endonuclease subunit S n=1 Tax=Cronobacter turicensis TaxID=413502 RepID=UPI0024C32FA0|nr:restriction endonuclease subunit S [Cronobacter turicensis]MDK1184519.1 restriction endonuclease subunit S [Cronobacter turicensis]MDK1205938.1 restriction endonuclease subunit S [Cronobacter turicensis]MDK1213288.1 restriction endonuclease subunit S [Cronobacter turicensis]MDK1217658.1 restriction endonuclease subunit S [Cronobacter turicensis]MDK1230763.1 restriction endonuclease subunit S [Cronobacter turicensis]